MSKPRKGKRTPAPETRGGSAGKSKGALSPVTREETGPVAAGAVALAFVSLLFCYSRGYILLYGDAVAHLGIARRIFDSRNPGLAQLGGVWLPLPHLMMLPFVQRLDWWQSGIAGAWPSMVCYVLSVVGLYRLSRWLMPARWAVVATAFYALNPNLLYLSTTAMTEPVFLAEFIWISLLGVECCAAIRLGRAPEASRRLVALGLLVIAAVYTRYDGWMLGPVVWCLVAVQFYRHRETFRRAKFAYLFFTVLMVAAPAGWLLYNQHYFHDPLDFMRGPYSAAAIDKKTSPPGARHYRGWHNPGWALLFYTRVAQVDAAAWETGFAVMAAALVGASISIRRQWRRAALLLWLPLPFYVYSVAYGSVPLFIPQLWPHSYYNSRYGMEMLPALSVFPAYALSFWGERLKAKHALQERLLQPVAVLLIALNAVAMMYFVPLVLKEGKVNATTRTAFESAIAGQLQNLPAGVPLLMYNSDHIGALQQAGIPLRQTVNEGDYDSWMAALAQPAKHAAYVVAIAGDPVSKAVALHPEGLTELTVLCTTGQPCARIYRSDEYSPPGR